MLADKPITPATVIPIPSSGSTNSADDRPVRFRHINDLICNAKRVELEHEDGGDKQVLRVEVYEPSHYLEATEHAVCDEAMVKEIEAIEKKNLDPC